MVIIDELHGTNRYRSDITIKIENYHGTDAGQFEVVKEESPYKNGELRKKTKGKFRRF